MANVNKYNNMYRMLDKNGRLNPFTDILSGREFGM